MKKIFTELMNIHRADDGGENTFFRVFALAFALVATVIIVALVAIVLDVKNSASFNPNLSKFGVLGDFIGGILNPLLAFLVLIVLLSTTRLQKEELRATKNELAKSVEATEKQGFENTFFNFMRLINENVRSTKVLETGTTYKSGAEAFELIYLQLYRNCSNAERQVGNLLFPRVYRKNRSELGHYIRLLYWSLNFIKEYEQVEHIVDGNIPTKSNSIYGKILRAQLSDHELALLFYNCLSDNGTSFIPLAIYFDLFNSLADDLMIDPTHKARLVAKIWSLENTFS